MAKKIKLVFEVQGAEGAENKTKKVDSALGDLAKKAGAVTVAFLGAGKLRDAFQTATRVGSEFEQNIKNLSVIAGATGGKLRQLEQSALKLGGSTKFTASEVANLQIEFSKLGFTSDEILDVTEGTLNLSTAFGLDLATSASVAGSTLRAFGLDASETTRLTDVMATSFGSTALDMDKFANSMSFVAPVAKVAGFSLEETTAILGTLANAGISGSMAGTSLRQVFLELSNENSKLAKRLGGTVSNSEELEQALAKLKEEGIGTAEMKQLVGQRAVSAFSILLDGAGTVSDLTTAFNDANGAGKLMADEMLDTLESKFKIMNSATEDLGIAFFKTFDEQLKNATDVMIETIGKTAEFFKLLDESPLETAIRRIDALGGNTLELRTQLAEMNLEQAKLGMETLPTVNEAMDKQAQNNARLIELEKELIPLKNEDAIATEAVATVQRNQFGLMSGLTAKVTEMIGISQNRTKELQAEKEALLADNEAQAEAIKKRQELKQAEADLQAVRVEAQTVQKEDDEAKPERIENEQKLFEAQSAQLQILGLKLELMEAGAEADEIARESILFQIENADRFNLSQEKRLQLQLQLLALNKKETDSEKKKSDEIRKMRQKSIEDAILHADTLEEASFKVIQAEASKAVASAIANIFASFPPPINAIMAPFAGATAMRLVSEGVKMASGKKFRQGGFVDGFGGGDRVPAMLEQGEFVMNKESVQAIGIQNLQELNAGRNAGGMNLVFNAPVTNEDFVRDFIAPTIEENLQRNLS
jgi:TP901 family phage tail tape measure protein